MGLGPAYWPDVAGGTVIADGGFYFDGSMIVGGQTLPLALDGASPGTSLRTMAKTTVRQRYLIGGSIPATIPTVAPTIGATLQVIDEADYWLVHEAVEVGEVIEIWFDWPRTDQWYVPGGEGNTEIWRTARPLPFGVVPGISQATRPPKVWIDAVSQTVNATGSPSSGVVVLPDSGGYEFLQTIALPADSYTWIKLRYHPTMLVAVTAISEQLIEHNSIVFDIEFEEHFGGLYLLAGGEVGGL